MSTTLRIWDGRNIPRVGIGCWAIGGPFMMGGRHDGWGEVDDKQSLKALALAHELGARLFDTADAYGTGHSEEVLGEAFGNRSLDKGPLPPAAMAEIEGLLMRELA